MGIVRALSGLVRLVTIHRPSNVDTYQALSEIIDILSLIRLPVLFPVHPRTQHRLEEDGLADHMQRLDHVKLLPPQPYIEFLSLLEGSRLMLSDSGSAQSEASCFEVPCLVCRENTERPIYLEEGTSELVGRDANLVQEALKRIEQGTYKKPNRRIRELGLNVAAKTVNRICMALDNSHS